MKMNWIVILGFILGALGSWLVYYGQGKESNKTSDEVKNKIDKFDEKLDNIIVENISAEEKERKIDEIKDEYSEWAAEFSNNKDQYKLEYKKNNIGLEEKKVSLNKEWREFYISFFNKLEAMVNAYNKIPNNNKVNIIHKDDLPTNIFDASRDNSNYIIKFNDTTFWQCSIDNREPFNVSNLPVIIIRVTRDQKDDSSNLDFFILVKDDRKKLLVNKNYRLVNAPLKDDYSIENPEAAINEILKSLFQYQIIELEEK